MTVPDFQSLMRPALEAHLDGQPHTTAEVRDRVAAIAKVPAEDRQVTSKGRSVYTKRVAWAVTHLAQAGTLSRVGRGLTQLTERGRQLIDAQSGRIDMRVLAGFPEYVEFRSRGNQDDKATSTESPAAEVAAPVFAPDDTALTPGDAISDMIATAHAAVASELLSRIIAQPPEFLERLVLDLMVRMGYGELISGTEHLGGPGDGGLDGLVRLDPLGLNVVYLQAKRYTDRTVGRPEIQAFVGALQGAQATQGVFIATSRFSADARNYAEKVHLKIILIDGRELARLMIKHDCGVAVEETYVLKQLDENFFDEG